MLAIGGFKTWSLIYLWGELNNAAMANPKTKSQNTMMLSGDGMKKRKEAGLGLS